MPRPKIAPSEKLSEPAFTLLRKGEKKKLDKLARRPGWSRARVLRESFLYWLESGQEPKESPSAD